MEQRLRVTRVWNSNNRSKLFEVMIEGESMRNAKTLHNNFTRSLSEKNICEWSKKTDI